MTQSNTNRKAEFDALIAEGKDFFDAWFSWNGLEIAEATDEQMAEEYGLIEATEGTSQG